MKIRFISIIVSLFLFSNLYGAETGDSLFLIRKIKSDANYFIIEAIKNDSLFLILSQKTTSEEDSIFNKYQIIKKNKYYRFELSKKRTKPGVLLGIINYLHVKNGRKSKPFNGFIDGKTKIKYKKKYHYKIYETKNLVGLYYVY